jgi:hypothetical protein
MKNQNKIKSITKKLQKFGTQFYIQMGHVKPINNYGIIVNELKEVFPLIFSENSESAYIFWKQIPIRFHYTYELYANFDAILDWLELLHNQSEGQYTTTLLTDIFIIELNAKWINNQLKIKTNWLEKDLHKNYALTINNKGAVITHVTTFLAEWKPLLLQIVKAIKTSEIKISNPKENEKIERIKKITPYISNTSILYTKSEI